MANRFQHMPHSMPETPNTYSANSHFTNHTYQGTQSRRYIIPHLLEHQTQHMNNKAFTKDGCPGQITGSTALLHVSTTILPSVPLI